MMMVILDNNNDNWVKMIDISFLLIVLGCYISLDARHVG